ncbi:methylated-DNA-[protein]-cysteine S-methyltransferase [Rhizomicrobium palustre]|uniref:Methylated-DNA-[protein]-cysteine S-methyltransferase n=1 Tax=Rhizomicrobium palustre TaxID=189966 RepID=A0A846MZG8_9PROT|nr:methylated-DNA--[protein]-cysteine S-methyltransferase [Rhizomicrobium palustre]NIK89018.1 methylated-DNA-[protein]-cysteine S-methyltransferase [Rhizomicrobium palustre]
MQTVLYHDAFDTPLGPSHLVCDQEGRLLLFGWYEGARWQKAFSGGDIMDQPNPFGLRDAFTAYFAGEVTRLDRLAIGVRGTDFQMEVWQALRTIPAGQTLSYGALAQRIGKANAVRAVGLANGANPIALAVPCHRVIGSSGSLTGYGGGLERKRWLLRHEAQFTGIGLFAQKL